MGPVVTFALFSFNQEKYIRAAIESAFAQTYTPLEILLSDDHSTDSTFEIMQDMAKSYCGPHRILLNRNTRNLGIGNHINRIMELTSGEWIVAAAGDDISLPERTSELMTTIAEGDGTVRSIWSRAQHIDENGVLLEKFIRSHDQQYSPEEIVNNERVVYGCAHAWHRGIFEYFGPLSSLVVFEDNALSFRSYLIGTIRYSDKRLVLYRVHQHNVTNYRFTKTATEEYGRMKRRKQAALVGIRQRLADLRTYSAQFAGNSTRDKILFRLLNRALVIQVLKIRVFKFQFAISRLLKSLSSS